MTLTLQIASLVALVALVAAWGSWVWDTHRPISTPEKLGEVVVHGVEETAAETTGRALAVGVAGAIAEHYRTVDFINTAAATADEFLLRPGATAPEPLLLQGKSSDERLDVSVEVAGAKIDSKGLSSLFRWTQRLRGSLALTVSLAPGGEAGQWRAVASASFPENSAYGFRTEATGALDEVAQMIGLRFVQAHYAVRDPFFVALGEEDFRKLWEVRREAAELALRGAGGDPSANDPLREEAKEEYRKIAHLLTRYRRRVELQKLGGYLATAKGDLRVARQHMEYVRDNTEDEEERRAIDSLLASLEVEIKNREERSPRAGPGTAAVSTVETPAALKEILEELAEKNMPLIDTLNLATLRSQDLPRPPRIGIVASPSKVWDDRVSYVGAADAPLDSALNQYSDAVLSLILSIAPQAEIVVSPVAGEGGGLTRSELHRALSALVGESLDVTFSAFGMSARALGEDGGKRWASSAGENLEALAGFGGLAVFPAGNDGLEVPKPESSNRAPAFAVIGARDNAGKRAPYTNFGQGVDFDAPDEVAVLSERGIVNQRGTAFSGAAFAAGAALVAAEVATPLSGSRLRDAIHETARPAAEGELSVPDFGAAAKQLATASD